MTVKEATAFAALDLSNDHDVSRRLSALAFGLSSLATKHAIANWASPAMEPPSPVAVAVGSITSPSSSPPDIAGTQNVEE